MEPRNEPTSGFGTTSSEWEILRLAYNLAVALSEGQEVTEEAVSHFRTKDREGNLMFDSWWQSRPEF